MKMIYPTVLLLALFSAADSFLGLYIPQSVNVMTALLPSGTDAMLCLLLSLMLLAASVVTFFCQRCYKISFGMAGVSLVVIALIGVVYPTYFGTQVELMRPSNLLVLFVTGITSLLAALEPGIESSEKTVEAPAAEHGTRRIAKGGIGLQLSPQ